MSSKRTAIKGSVDIIPVNETTESIRFTDFVSVFDAGRIPDVIPGKGKAVCDCVVKSCKIAKVIGVPTNFVERVDETTIHVEKFNIITGRNPTTADDNYLLKPFRWVSLLRNVPSTDRMISNALENPGKYGLHEGNAPGVGWTFPSPIHMFTAKDKDGYREISESEICQMSGLTLKDREEFWSMIDRLTGAIGQELYVSDLFPFDFTFRCIVGPGRRKMLSALMGMPECDRWCSVADLFKGKFKYYSKEYVLRDCISGDYRNALIEARANGSPDPPLPRLSKEQVEEIRRRYLGAAYWYTNRTPW